MKKTRIFYCLIIFVLWAVSGCAPLIIGAAAGGLGAVAVSKDAIQGDTDKSYDSIWNAALTVSRIRGAIKKEDYTRGNIELVSDSSRIWIRLIRLTHATTRLRISSRKHHLPNLDLAQDIFVKVMEEAK